MTARFQGRNLAELWRESAPTWRTAAFSEYRLGSRTDIDDFPLLRGQIRTEMDGKLGWEFERLWQNAQETDLDLFNLSGTRWRFWRPSFKTIRTARHRMTMRAVWREGQGDEPMGSLYDLEVDPYETRNLFGDPAHAALRDRLVAELKSWDFATATAAQRQHWPADSF
jgi:hypothetical protein